MTERPLSESHRKAREAHAEHCAERNGSYQDPHLELAEANPGKGGVWATIGSFALFVALYAVYDHSVGTRARVRQVRQETDAMVREVVESRRRAAQAQPEPAAVTPQYQYGATTKAQERMAQMFLDKLPKSVERDSEFAKDLGPIQRVLVPDWPMTVYWDARWEGDRLDIRSRRVGLEHDWNDWVPAMRFPGVSQGTWRPGDPVEYLQ